MEEDIKKKEKENILGYEKIGKLIRKFSIPCIISLVVNSIYNIVDQIFIGWGVDYLGNGATNVVFPLVMIALAFSLMFGDGTSAYLSLKLGEKKKEEAAKGVANGIIISAIGSLTLCILGFAFLPQIINLFGCTDALRTYALNYGYVIVLGLPFMMIGTTLNSIIRADGNPKYAMNSMVLGAILNIILDPIFIFVFKMQVTGAAIATVLSQILTFVLNVMYIKKIKSVKLEKSDFKINFKTSKTVSMLGISSFITQMSIVFVMAFENNLLSKYGMQSKFGAEIPITVLGIVMKISQILNSIIIGIAAGAQPILGYNYGAGKYDRVKKTLKIVLGISLIVSTVAFILFQLIPDKLIGMFGSGNDLYIEFACLSFRIYLMLCIANGVQIPSGIFFQAIGKSGKSAFLSLSRQILFLIPGMVILGKLFGIMGVLYAGPIADAMAFIFSTTFMIIEIKKLTRKDSNCVNEKEKIETNKKTEGNIVITVSREYGSGGRYVAKLISEKLGIKLYDKEIINELSKNTGLSSEYIENTEEKMNSLDKLNNGYYSGLTNSDELFIAESNLIKDLAKNTSCIIVGRCADYILKDRKNVFNIFVYSSMENKIKRAVERYGLTKENAIKEIKTINKLRSNHYKNYTGNNWGEVSNYDLCINSDTLGVENTADLICNMIAKENNILK